MSLHAPHQQISDRVRLRYAPSPTGHLHVGGARTALYNFLYAKQQGGDFILRIEDTDEARSTEDSLRMMIDDLEWLGLHWDEGPDPETLVDRGPYGPYRQSLRQSIYQQVADDLLKKGRAFYCFLTDTEIEKMRNEAVAAGRPAQLKSPYRKLPLAEAQNRIAAGDKAVVRFNTEGLEKDYVLQDLVRGEVALPSEMIGDFVLLRSGGFPVYNFCCVVDDHLMKITHVLRAEEHLPNTLRQLMIYEALGWAIPYFGHLSLVLDEDRKKLSKRTGATSCTEFKNEGYLPEALNNYVALLGWSSPKGDEILSMAEMQRQFSLDRFSPSGAVFDRVKLKWLNSVHLRAKSDEELWGLMTPFIKHLDLPQDPEWRARSLGVFRQKMETLKDAASLYEPLSQKHFKIHPEANEALSWPTTKEVLRIWLEELEARKTPYLSEADFIEIENTIKTAANVKGKQLFQALRVPVIGTPQGPEMKILVPLIARENLIARARSL